MDIVQNSNQTYLKMDRSRLYVVVAFLNGAFT